LFDCRCTCCDRKWAVMDAAKNIIFELRGDCCICQWICCPKDIPFDVSKTPFLKSSNCYRRGVILDLQMSLTMQHQPNKHSYTYNAKRLSLFNISMGVLGGQEVIKSFDKILPKQVGYMDRINWIRSQCSQRHVAVKFCGSSFFVSFFAEVWRWLKWILLQRAERCNACLWIISDSHQRWHRISRHVRQAMGRILPRIVHECR
jgi:hypothetical protein